MSKERIEKNDDGSSIVRLKNVRLSFPDLWTPKAFAGETSAKFAATFIARKTGDGDRNLEFLKEAVNHAIATALKGKNPGSEKLCLRDGSTKPDVDGFGDEVVYVKASSKTRPMVVNKDLSVLTAEDDVIYAGCYVNAVIRIWPQDNDFGKRVNAQLKAVQFVKDGDPFGDGKLDPEDAFDKIDSTGADLI